MALTKVKGSVWDGEDNGQALSVKDYGAVGNGIADDTAAINAAITASTGDILFPDSSGEYLISSAITLKNNVRLILDQGATIKWVGAAGGSMFTSATDDVLVSSGIVGGTIDYNTTNPAGKVLDLHSHQDCEFEFVTIGVSTTNTVMYMRADSTAGTGPTGTANAARNRYRVRSLGDCGTFLNAAGQASPLQPFTLNEFQNSFSNLCYVKGIDIPNWFDHNTFSGITRMRIRENNAVGVDLSSNDPATDEGVYGIHFDSLTVDAYSTFTGRIGIKLGTVRFITCDYYFQDGTLESEGGSVSTHANTVSYRIISERPDASGTLQHLQKGVHPQAFFQANGASAGLIANSATPVTVTYSTEAYDTNGDFNEATGIFTAPTKGQYEFTVMISHAAGGATTIGDVFALDIINTNTGIFYRKMYPVLTITEQDTVQLSCVLHCNESNTVISRISRLSGTGSLTVLTGDATKVFFTGSYQHA